MTAAISDEANDDFHIVHPSTALGQLLEHLRNNASTKNGEAKAVEKLSMPITGQR